MKPLPCPFCGHIPNVTDKERGYDGGWAVVCENVMPTCGPPEIGCDTQPRTLPHTSAEAAIQSWNKRRPYVI